MEYNSNGNNKTSFGDVPSLVSFASSSCSFVEAPSSETTSSISEIISDSSSAYKTLDRRPTVPVLLDPDEEAYRQEWIDFSQDVDMTPPAKTKRSVSQTIEIGERILQQVGCSLSWKELSPKQQAEMAFMITEDFHELGKHGFGSTAEMMVSAIFEIGPHGPLFQQNLWNFVRKFGDHVYGCGESATSPDGGPAKYQQHIENHPVYWNSPENSMTMFASNPKVPPLLRYQEPNSMACSPVQGAVILHYTQCCNAQREIQTKNVDKSKTEKLSCYNIRRFMRYELSSEEKFDYIFHSGGFNLLYTLKKMLLPMNPDIQDSSDFSSYVCIDWEVDEMELFNRLSNFLSTRPMFTNKFKLYEEYGSSDTCLASDLKTYKSGQSYHNIIIVGVSRIPDGSDGGIMFLVQDSDCAYPFKNISRSVLLQMRVRHLFAIDDSDIGIKLPTDSVLSMEPNFVCSISGGHTPRPMTDAEWRAPGGPYERYLAWTQPNYKPTWTMTSKELRDLR